MKTVRPVVWNTFLVLALNMIQRGAGALAFIVIGRSGATGTAGVFSLALGYLAILTTIFASLDDILTRECVRVADDTSSLVVTYGPFRLVLSTLSWIVLWIILAQTAVYMAVDLTVVVFVTSSVMVDAFSGIAQSVLNARGQFGWPFLAMTVTTIIRLGWVAGWVIGYSDPRALAIAWPFGSSFSAIMLVGVLWLRLFPGRRNPRLRFNSKWAKQLAQVIPGFMMASLLSGLEYQLDVVLLSVLMSTQAVALYSGAATIMALVLTLPQAYRSVLFPAIVRSLTRQPSTTPRLVKRSLIIMGGLSLLTASVTSMLAGPLIRILLGQHFNESIPVLQVLVWNVVLVSLNVPLVRFMLATDRQSIVWRVVLGTLTVNVVANLLFLPPLGILGAAYARLLSSGLFCGVMLWLVSRRLHDLSTTSLTHG